MMAAAVPAAGGGGGSGIVAVSGQAGGTESPADDTSVTKAFAGNVTAGNLIVIKAGKYNSTTDVTFTSANCTKSAGTATLGTISLDVQVGLASTPASAEYIHVGIWSAIVTGSGSLTMNVASSSSSFWMIAVNEFEGNWDAARLEDTSTDGTATNAVTAASTGAATSAGAALFTAIVGPNQPDNSTITPDASYSAEYEQENGNLYMCGSALFRIVTSGTTDSCDWTIPSNNNGYVAALAVYKEA